MTDFLNAPHFLAALRDISAPDEPAALSIADVVLSRSQVRDAAAAFAAGIHGQPGPIAIYATPSPETIIASVGCLLAGVPFVPVPPDAGAAERAHVLTNSAATQWVGPTDLVDLPTLNVELSPTSAPAVPEPAPESRIGAILYTSGTTGAPKGVLISQGALKAGIDGLAQAWEWTADDTVAHGLPLFHTHGLILGVLGSFHIGSRVIHTGKPTPQAYAEANATMYFGVPTVWTRIARDPESARALASARLLVSGSAPLPVPIFEQLRDLTGQAPLERYGMTETMLTLSTRAGGERRPGWVGLPVAGAETRIRGEDGGLAPHDGQSVGQLEVRGPMLFDGYLGLPEVTAASYTEDGWFRTGDLAVIDEVGFHRIVGRESVDLIKSGGYRIGAGEIETSLLARSEVSEVGVVGLPDDDLGQRIVAFIVPSAEINATDELAAELIAHVAEDLSWHKRPREIRFVPSLPRNQMGKIQKKQLLPG